MGKVFVAVFLPIIAIVLGVYLNFPDFLKGDQATIKNLIVTIFYIIIWLFCLKIVAKSNKLSIMLSYAVFWLLSIYYSGFTVFANFSEYDASWAIPMIAILMPQWYGIELIVDDLLISSMIITIISLIFFTASVILTIKKLVSINAENK